MLPDREGRFKARAIERGVAESGPNNLATFICQFQLHEELGDNEWLPIEEELEITGYFYLEKKDGSLNTSTIDAIKRAFGWDGRDPFWLQDTDLGETVVQLKLAFEEYDGKQRIKVQYLDAEDATPGGVKKADDAARRGIGTRLGSKLRAMAGGTPAPAPKPAGRPAAPPKTNKAPAKSPAAASDEVTMQTVWAEFCQACPNASDDRISAEWFRILAELFPGKKPEELAPADWGRMRGEGIARIVPF